MPPGTPQPAAVVSLRASPMPQNAGGPVGNEAQTRMYGYPSAGAGGQPCMLISVPPPTAGNMSASGQNPQQPMVLQTVMGANGQQYMVVSPSMLSR